MTWRSRAVDKRKVDRVVHAVAGAVLPLPAHRRVARPLLDTVRLSLPTALYVHIPFCASRCFYCDFTTAVAPASVIESYLDSLFAELRLLGPLAAPLRSVFFGGGTPSLLSTVQWQRLLEHLHTCFELRSDVELTVEVNPGTVSREKLAQLRAGGVTRLSFGGQTFDERLLQTIGRLHDASAIRQGITLARDSGFEHINLDLMFGLPEQTLRDVEASLAEALRLPLDHVSAYWLKVEPGTPFARWQAAGMLPLPGEDAEADMYDLVSRNLGAAGFRHYEISNFARPGGEAEHNLVYWRNQPYLAAGVGAHGYVDGRRYANVSKLVDYRQALGSGRLPRAREAYVPLREACEDTMMLGLRLQEGVAKATFRQRHGVSMETMFGPQLSKLRALGLIEDDQLRVCLTAVARPIANVVFEEFVSLPS